MIFQKSTQFMGNTSKYSLQHVLVWLLLNCRKMLNF